MTAHDGGYASPVLDWAHKLTLRSVADGDADESPALRTLVASRLVEQRPDGTHAITPAGRVALEDDEHGSMAAFSELSGGTFAGLLLAVAVFLAAVNTVRGDALLTKLQLVSLLLAAVVMSLGIAYAKRAAR